MTRSYAELMGLEVEAERLVRMGESRAEVSRRLGVHPQTLATWALRGGWRKKDLDMERHVEIARETVRAIRNGNRAADRHVAAREALQGFMKQAVDLLAKGDDDAMAELARMLGGVENQQRLEAPKVVLGPDPNMMPRSLGDRDPDAPREPITDEDGVAWTPERQREANRRAQAQLRRLR